MKMVQGIEGSLGNFVFLSNNSFHLYAYSREFGFDVFATIIQPDT
jgi:hypothetical protein